jgi:hypothetical protein
MTIDETILQDILTGNPEALKGALKKLDEAFEDDSVFRVLDEDETYKFRQWAQDNYEPFTKINPIWHPIVRNECSLMNKGMIFDQDKRKRAEETLEKLLREHMEET